MIRGRWTSVTVRSPQKRGEVSDALFAIGAEGVQELGADLVTHLRDADRNEVTKAVHRADASASLEFAETPDVDWSQAWRSRISAHRVGNLVVTPPWLAHDEDDVAQIVIEPEMAFGTGEHETTRGVLRLMQHVVRAGDVVADLGAGSAVLAIAAAKLGAARCVAIEMDADAIANAESNVRRNGVEDRVTVLEGDAVALLPLVAPVRVVLANIISSVLIQLLPVIRVALTSDGAAILSGILVDERDAMTDALRTAGWRVTDVDEEGQWWSAAITVA
ncbi:MAG TPA: 50S ribosomal protein L11 methyltransferase [Gemmatimonadaceae bacterium]|nr:50S ribosomal protein L11 methyltransferase [Gemmatimonadaceae bacterium]